MIRDRLATTPLPLGFEGVRKGEVRQIRAAGLILAAEGGHAEIRVDSYAGPAGRPFANHRLCLFGDREIQATPKLGVAADFLSLKLRRENPSRAPRLKVLAGRDGEWNEVFDTKGRDISQPKAYRQAEIVTIGLPAGFKELRLINTAEKGHGILIDELFFHDERLH